MCVLSLFVEFVINFVCFVCLFVFVFLTTNFAIFIYLLTSRSSCGRFWGLGSCGWRMVVVRRYVLKISSEGGGAWPCTTYSICCHCTSVGLWGSKWFAGGGDCVGDKLFWVGFVLSLELRQSWRVPAVFSLDAFLFGLGPWLFSVVCVSQWCWSCLCRVIVWPR